ncbi:MAG TPA: DinB family protein [Sphingomonas sp.]|nr:DinB family protein [Sphingomonas sp.]
MTTQPYSHLIRLKQWADRGLYQVVEDNLDRLDAEERTIVIRILDHIHVVDRIFQHHLQGRPHSFAAPRSDVLPDIARLANDARSVDDWYVAYIDRLSAADVEAPVDFVYTNGNPMQMTRGEILLHVCLHGTYHRGNAGILFQKKGIAPNRDAVTDYLEAAA